MKGVAALRPLAGLLSPAGRRARLTVLIYHRVVPERDPLRPDEPDAAAFAWQMETLATLFNVLPLGEAVGRLRAGTLPVRAACVTFDDGYADNHDEASPILRAVGIPATFFVATGFLNGGRMFNDTVIEVLRRVPAGPLDLTDLGLGTVTVPVGVQARLGLVRTLLERLKRTTLGERARLERALRGISPGQLPTRLMMTDAQVMALARQGMEIGAHTVDHPLLTHIATDEARREIAESQQFLERLTGARVSLFAYPNGRRGDDFDARHSALVRALGFDGAVTTHRAVAGPGSDPYALPRATPWDRTPVRFAIRLIRNLVRVEAPDTGAAAA